MKSILISTVQHRQLKVAELCLMEDLPVNEDLSPNATHCGSWFAFLEAEGIFSKDLELRKKREGILTTILTSKPHLAHGLAYVRASSHVRAIDMADATCQAVFHHYAYDSTGNRSISIYIISAISFPLNVLIMHLGSSH